MTEELTLLAEAGAAAVVAAMATDLWQSTREAVLGLFRRGDPDRSASVEARLDTNASMVRGTASPDDVRQALLGAWALELEALLRRAPSCRTSLARLVAEVDGALRGGRGRPVLEQTNTARDSGTVFAVQHGDLHAYGPDRAGPPPGADRSS
ncbi:hypothetical protein GCM10010406_04610 [Streptomyces thermolineatus]|uniref:Uncharacterized protein n=1 Tax=Streptomyces thermolineatus TaxID=44033 RepID=A0ABN3KXB2_9ACTN